jgi:hypothetical protein
MTSRRSTRSYRGLLATGALAALAIGLLYLRWNPIREFVHAILVSALILGAFWALSPELVLIRVLHALDRRRHQESARRRREARERS